MGVDVFFVISGYLITGSLMREYRRAGKISLATFYARRVRRLLPAATLVLLATALALEFLPRVMWNATATELVASAVYAQNWWLALNGETYLGGFEPPTPLHHYWSLSIEEQFYILWPLVVAFGGRSKRPRLAISITMGIIVTASLLLCLQTTHAFGGWSYFSSFARAWELGVGGLMSLLLEKRQGSRFPSSLAIVGLGLILSSAILFDSTTVFPGAHALLPTCGTVLLIFGTRNRGQGLAAGLGTGPMRFVGDISYSLYLWHWPVIVYSGISADPSVAQGATLILLAGILSYFTKQYIEDPIRFGTRRVVPSLAMGLTLVCASVVVGLLLISTGPVVQKSGTVESGAQTSDVLAVRAVHARRDLPHTYKRGCHGPAELKQARDCSFGFQRPTMSIALIGDSHAAQWFPTLARLAEERGWQINNYTKSACTIAETTVIRKGEVYTECEEWRSDLAARLTVEQPDAIVIGSSRRYRTTKKNHVEELRVGLSAAHSQLSKIAPTVFVADTPMQKTDVPVCLSKPGTTADACSNPLDREQREDPILKLDQSVIDLSEFICPQEQCPALLNGEIVWRDSQHLTASFARTLAAAFAKQLDESLSQNGSRTD